MGVELLDGVVGRAEECPGRGVGLVVKDGSEDLGVSGNERRLQFLEALSVGLDGGVVPGRGRGRRVGRWIEGDMGKVNNFWTKRGMCGVKVGIDRSIDDD